jgi:hypothetical protein
MIRSMTKKEFEKYLQRDRGCWHCGLTDDTLIPQHRKNRQAGGKNKAAEQPSNIIVLCSQANGLLESNANFAELGRKLGWKLRSHESPTEVPIFGHGGWWLLNDDFTKDLLETQPEYF